MTTTVRLLSTYGNFRPNTIVELDDATAAALLLGGVGATTDLTGGVPAFGNDAAIAAGDENELPDQKLGVGRTKINLPAGKAVTLTSVAGSISRVAPLDATGAEGASTTLNNGAMAVFGPYREAKTLQVSTYSGAVSATVRALPARGAEQADPSRVVLLGDSITWFGFDNTAVSGKPSLAVTNRAIVEAANALLYQRLNIVQRAGVSGNRIDQMYARFNTDVAAHRPTLVILQGCSNDLDQGYSAAQIFPSIVAIFRASQAIGASFIYIGTSGMSRGTGAPVSPIDGVQYRADNEMAALQARCRRAQFEMEGFRYFDMAYAMRDYGAAIGAQGAAFGTTLAGTVLDGTHPEPYGCYLMARRLAPYLDKVCLGTNAERATLNGRGVDGDTDNISGGNYLMMGTYRTTNVTAPNTGSGPDPWNVTRTGSIQAVCSNADRTDDGPGRIFRLDVSGSAALTDAVTLSASAAYAKAIGIPAYIQALVRVSAITSGAIHNVTGNLQFFDSGSNLLGQVWFGVPHSTKAGNGFTGLTSTVDLGLMRSPRMNVPVGTASVLTRIAIYTTVGAQLTVDLCEAGARVDQEYPDVAKYRV
jgi:lysophospholipase L1-like esterase